ncbi:beta-1,3-glucanase family protein [Streptomyces sp. NPDC048639]|uniref:beta-1,3-glucanase family protein n=1 Tax=Streptomyces sp. NPDC048639 TaxID=3365581 RepID=UPI003719318A
MLPVVAILPWNHYRDQTTDPWSQIVPANSPQGYGFRYDDVSTADQHPVDGGTNDATPTRRRISEVRHSPATAPSGRPRVRGGRTVVNADDWGGP